MNLKCPKCGDECVYLDYSYWSKKLHCKCSRCRYEWKVEPLDSPLRKEVP